MACGKTARQLSKTAMGARVNKWLANGSLMRYSTDSMKAEVKARIAKLRQERALIDKKIEVAEAFFLTLDEDESQHPPLPAAAEDSATALNGVRNMAPPDAYGKNVKLVRLGLMGVDDTFSVSNVEAALLRKGTPLSRDTISQVLHKLSRSGELIVEERGSGRRPSIYRMAEKPARPALF